MVSIILHKLMEAESRDWKAHEVAIIKVKRNKSINSHFETGSKKKNTFEDDQGYK